MKKFVAILLCACIIALSGCGVAKKQNGSKIIATSIYPVYIFTLNITDGIDDIQVKCMAEQNMGCLHDYSLTAGDAKLISDCRAFVVNGAGMEGFLHDLESLSDEAKIIDSSEGVELICAHGHEGEHHSEEEHGHSHAENSHIWMSVANAVIQVGNICNGLCESFPEYEDVFRENTREYIIRLNALQKDISVAGESLSGKSFISFHDAYAYLAEDLGFNILTTLETDEGGEPSAKKLSHLSDEIKENDVSALIVETNYTGSAAQILSEETDVAICTLNPVLRGEKNKNSYEKLMRENIHILEQTLK